MRPASESSDGARWHLYRLLADPVRLRLLALAAEAELSVGELAELLDQTQPNVSRHTGPLRQAGLLVDRRDGTRTLLRLTEHSRTDPVVADALAEGRKLCERDGSVDRVPDVLRARDEKTREYFASDHAAADAEPRELGAYLFALGAVLPRRGTAVDAGTGDGTVLEAMAPFFERVIAIDRSEARLEKARRRAEARGYDHVELVRGEVDGLEARKAVGKGAELVVAGRMLHHAPVPQRMVAALAALVAPGGKLLVVDYAPHDDEAFRESQADVWTGFEASELAQFAAQAGLSHPRVAPIPDGCFTASPRRGKAPRIPWQALVATKPEAPHPSVNAAKGQRQRA